ncbi:MAG: NAD(P)H-hydrate dehydratase [Pseudomonadota bacterium]
MADAETPADVVRFAAERLRAYNAAEARALDRAAQASGIDGFELMRRAGLAALDAIAARYPQARELRLLAGKGNNGGDAYVVAGAARKTGWRVRLWQVIGDARDLTGEAAQARDWAAELGVEPETGTIDLGEVGSGALVVDGLFGTGLTRDIDGDLRDLVLRLNAQALPVVALDVPSGLDADNGAVRGTVVHADMTVTFIGQKLGLLTGQGPAVSGHTLVAELGLAPARLLPAAGVEVLDARAARLPARRATAYKNQFGHVVLLGGDHGGGGAIMLAAEAALRAGAGLVSVGTRAEHVQPLLTRRPEIMVRPVESRPEAAALIERASVVCVGPGLGTAGWGEQLLAAAVEANKPLIVDADGLNLLAQRGDLSLPSQAFLTPHPGEAARLLEISSADVERDRVAAVSALARRHAAHVVLKGAGSLVANADGLRAVCVAGNPGMASAGMGDALAGAVAALVAQRGADTAALGAAVAAHAAAGDRAAARIGEPGLLASDLIAELPAVLSGAASAASDASDA